MDVYNFDWEAHETLTEDGWYLTLFQIKSPNGGSDDEKAPVLCIHGASDDAASWASVGIGGPSLPLALVDHGYDVWMANSRGT